MLEKQLNETRIQFSNGDLDWKQAISLAVKPLVDDGTVEGSYVDAIFNKALEYGPFFDLGKGIAIPHARPEEGVNKVGISILVVKEPVYLLDLEDHPIDIFITLAATDADSHVDLLRELTEILIDDDKVEAIKKSVTPQDVIEIIRRN